MRKKTVIVVSSPMTINYFLKDQVIALSAQYDVTVITNAKNILELGTVAQYVEFIPLDIHREIALWSDLRALWRLFLCFRKNNFDLVHSVTPKAGLLAMLAAFFARIPIRIHMFTGQVWVNRQSISRVLLKLMDKLIAGCANTILVDSESQREFLIYEDVVSRQSSIVMAKGSISGVDLDRFCLNKDTRKDIRMHLGLNKDSVAVLFLGRLKKDKGIIELARAFYLLAQKFSDVHLVIVGPDEDGLQDEVEHVVADYNSRLHFVAQTSKPEAYMMACDIFCLPSYREGFGSVVIEAAACGIPAVGSRIYGVTDAIAENKTGLLFTPGDVNGLAGTLAILLKDPLRRQELGKNALSRVQLDFSREYVTRELLNLYEIKLL